MNQPYGYRMHHQLVTSDMYSACIKYVETNLVNSKEAATLIHQYNLK